MSDITEKTDALCSNAESLKQCLTDLVTMVRTQAETIESLENTNKNLIQQHDEEIEQLTLKLTEKDKELNEVTVENTTLHSNIADLRKRINNCEGQLRKQCESVVSLQKTNSGLLNYRGEISQLKLQLTKKENKLREVVANNQILVSKVKSQQEHIARNEMCITHLIGLTHLYDKDNKLKEREGEIEQLRFKLTETRQKLRDETKKYDELLKSSKKPGVKATNDIQSTEESESMSSSDEDSKFEEDEVIEDTNKKKLMNENPSSHTSAKEGRKAIKRKGKNDGGPVSKIAGPGKSVLSCPTCGRVVLYFNE